MSGPDWSFYPEDARKPGGERAVFRAMSRDLRDRRRKMMFARYAELMDRQKGGEDINPSELRMLQDDIDFEFPPLSRHPIVIAFAFLVWIIISLLAGFALGHWSLRR